MKVTESKNRRVQHVTWRVGAQDVTLITAPWRLKTSRVAIDRGAAASMNDRAPLRHVTNQLVCWFVVLGSAGSFSGSSG